MFCFFIHYVLFHVSRWWGDTPFAGINKWLIYNKYSMFCFYWISQLSLWEEVYHGALSNWSLGYRSFIFHRRWHSCTQVKTLADYLFVLCKLTYFDSATTEQLLIISPLNFVPEDIVFMSYRNSGCIRLTILKINAIETSHFIKEMYRQPPMFAPCSLTVTSTWRPGLTAH